MTDQEKTSNGKSATFHDKIGLLKLSIIRKVYVFAHSSHPR